MQVARHIEVGILHALCFSNEFLSIGAFRENRPQTQRKRSIDLLSTCSRSASLFLCHKEAILFEPLLAGRYNRYKSIEFTTARSPTSLLILIIVLQIRLSSLIKTELILYIIFGAVLGSTRFWDWKPLLDNFDFIPVIISVTACLCLEQHALYGVHHAVRLCAQNI